MKDGEIHIDYVLLGKFLSGESTPDENMRVEEWKRFSKENLAQFERLVRLWQEADSLINTTPARVDLNAAWNKLSDRLFGDEVSIETPGMQKSPAREGETEALSKTSKKQVGGFDHTLRKARTRTLYYYATRIAAVLVIGFLVYAIFLMLPGRSERVEILAGNAIAVTKLPDDSKITLNEHSVITYPENFRHREREVTLEGEAFFEVQPDEQKPFVVRAHNAVIRVLGTSFNVRAIESEPEISVTVEEGKVRFADEEDVIYVILERNEKGIFNRETGHIEKYERAEGSEMFWKSRTLMFRETRLAVVFSTLGKLYEKEIIVKNEAILTCELTAKFQDMDIDEILDKIAINFNLTIQKTNNTFEISGEGC